MDVLPADTPEYAKELELPARKVRGWVHEVEVPMRAGDTLHYESDHASAGRVEFNVHSHQGKDVTYYAKGVEATLRGAFTAPREGKFYLMWENLADRPVRVRIRATRHEVRTGPMAEGEGHRHR